MKFMVFLVCFCSANIVCQVYGRDISASKEKLGLNRGMANGLNGGMANGLPQMPQVVSGVPLLVFQQPGVPNGQQGQTGLPLTPQLNPNQLPQQALDMPQLQGQLLQLPNGMLTQLGFPQQPGVGLQYYVVLPQSNPAGVQQPMNPVQQQVQLQGLPVNVGNCIQQQAIAQAAAVAQAQAQAAVKRVKHSASGMAHPVREPVPGTGMPAVTGEETQVSSGSIATGPALTGEALNPFSV
ncbi:uncharacterized protein LOC117420486 [Acipenser ruthenus]|uniref:uncharacterized protein LOC117420486 n=1 Tax=Acipenser ruthenus TaxID=7906 RepID=UPI00145A617D|nr:uncharacterized protein LOC117420486 [Acipenser ruthenus]XP_058883935.1 uncharacterized protein LOC117420486 [Acipenser ruthenus]